MNNILIIGGGLTGLTTAYLLEKEGINTTIVEARNRLGGRIETHRDKQEAPIEMGATWLGEKHNHLISLLKELNIGIYEQFMGSKAYYEPISTSPPQLVSLPSNEEPTYRIEGGSDHLIQELHGNLEGSKIFLNQPAISIRRDGGKLLIKTKERQLSADFVISTLPPKLLANSISFSPELPSSFKDVALHTDTWMEKSIKIGLTYDTAFWRNADTSGTIMSNVGPITEMYDHSDKHSSFYALKGFMNEAFYAVSEEERRERVLDQLTKFYGDQALNYRSYQEKVWPEETYTFSDAGHHIIPHQNNGHSVFENKYLNGQLLIGGAETAEAFPGYMDGAVESAIKISTRIKEIIALD